MAVFIDMNNCELNQIELAIKNCKDHPELDFTNDQVFLVGTPTEFTAETIRQEMSKKYNYVSPKKFNGELPAHLVESE